METKTMTTTELQVGARIRREPNPAYMTARERFRSAFKETGVSDYQIASFILARVAFHADAFGGGKAPSATTFALEKMRRAFGPITNPVKLANGRKPFDTMESLLRTIERNGPARSICEEVSEEDGRAIMALAKDALQEHRATRGEQR